MISFSTEKKNKRNHIKFVEKIHYKILLATKYELFINVEKDVFKAIVLPNYQQRKRDNEALTSKVHDELQKTAKNTSFKKFRYNLA